MILTHSIPPLLIVYRIRGRAWERVWIVACILFAILSSPALAQIASPSVRSTKPIGLVPGQSLTLEIRGENLNTASSLLFEDLAIKIEALESTEDVLKAKLVIPTTATPGVYFFRVLTCKGLSNPGQIVITRPISKTGETGEHHGFRTAQIISAPCTIEGSLKNGEEVDLYSVEMKAGQTLVVEAFSARMGSGLDALATIFSAEGREIASDDDLFGRDAACWATIPTSGRYFVQIQDANGRNPDANTESKTTREYLLSIGDIPLVISAYPPGARRGSETQFDFIGVNLPEGLSFRSTFPVDHALGDALLKVDAPRGIANALTIRVSDTPELVEPDPEPSDDPLRPTPAVVPGAISGRFRNIDDGDIDYFHLVPTPGFEGDYAISVYSAKIGSPADPIVSIVDPRGVSQVEDDDKLGRDSRIERRIPVEGLTIAIREAFGRGGPRFIYRVEVEPMPRRRITATVNLEGRSIPRNGSIALPITLERQEDDGPATILAGELPLGVTAAPVTIPEKGKGGILVLSATADAALGVFPFRLAIRDTRGIPQAAYVERGERRGPPRPNNDALKMNLKTIPVDRPLMAVTESASLRVKIEPEEMIIKPEGTIDIKVTIDRRQESAKGAVKIRLVTGDGALDGFDKVDEATIPAEKSEYVFKLKANKGATPRRVVLSVKAWLASGNENQAVDAKPAALVVDGGSVH